MCRLRKSIASHFDPKLFLHSELCLAAADSSVDSSFHFSQSVYLKYTLNVIFRASAEFVNFGSIYNVQMYIINVYR